MTVLIYVNTSKQVGDPEHLKVFANADAAKHGSRKIGRRHAVDHGLGANMERAWARR